MGRRKISIQPITDERNRKVTFVKRKAGLFKKAHELAVLCQVDLAVIILGNNNNKFYEYNSVETDSLLAAYKDSRYTHDVKTPADYGDYAVESRVKNSTLRTHHRNASSVSFSVEEEEDEEEEDDDDEDDDEDDKDTTKKPPAKRRKVKGRTEPAPKAKSSLSTATAPPSVPASSHPQIQYMAEMPPQQQQYQHPMAPPGWGAPPQPTNMDPNQQMHPHYPQFHMQGVPQQYQFPLAGNFASPYQQQAQLQQQQQRVQRQQQRVQRPHSNPDLPSVGTPLVQNSQSYQNNSPFMNSRARTLNNNISSRPILRVEIPSDPTKPAQGTKPGDSALTLTALETAKQENGPQGTDGSAKQKDSGEKTPPSSKSNDEIKPAGLGILSNNSTPVSATLPSGLFNLPPPQPHLHYQQHSNIRLMPGEQTPLTGGLPSRYVPDLFPSPSNFYSNEWNIPFGSGNTPYPSSAVANHLLPLPGGNSSSAGTSNNVTTGGGTNNNKVRKHTNLSNDPSVDSPLQTIKDGANVSKKKAKAPMGSRFESKKINFNSAVKKEKDEFEEDVNVDGNSSDQDREVEDAQ